MDRATIELIEMLDVYAEGMELDPPTPEEVHELSKTLIELLSKLGPLTLQNGS